MARKLFSLRSILIMFSFIIAGLIAWIFFPLLVVRDRTGGVSTVAVVNTRQRQSLTSLGGDTFVAFPKVEGAIEVRCPNGSTKVFGYVSKNTRSWIEITPDVAC